MNSRKKILLGVAALAVVGAAGYYFTRNGYTEPDIRLASDTAQTDNAKKIEQSKDLTVIYSEEVKTTQDSTRSWPTVNIMRRVGKAEPEKLATIGKVGEYPMSTQPIITNDNKYLFISLESKVQKLDLSTKKLTDVFKPKLEVSSMVLSPDQKKLFVWDQKYASEDQRYFLHVVDLLTLKDEIVSQGSNPTDKGFLFAKNWRADEKVILMIGAGEAAWPAYYDLKTKKLTETDQGDGFFGVLSPGGKIIAFPDSHIEDICNDFAGTSSNTFKLVDPVSGKVIKQGIGQSGMIGQILAISPEDKELIYAVYPPHKEQSTCEKQQPKTFYSYNIETDKTTQLANPNDTLRVWGMLSANIDYSYDSQTQKVTFKLGDELLFGPVESSSSNQIIKVY